jgi:hypothetical protein
MLQKILLVLFTSLLSVPPPDDNLVDWSISRKLSWADFKSKPDAGSSDAALTSSTINVEFGYDKNGLKHSITCRFNKLKSWARVKNNYILNHEQGHFDLAEGYARELHKELQEYTFNKQTVNDDLNKIYNRVMQKHLEEQNLYDRQTDHSLDTARQSVWNGKIKSMLAELEAFKEYK